MSTKLLLIFLLVFEFSILQAQETSMNNLQLMPWPQEVALNSSDFGITNEFNVFIHGEVKKDSKIFKATTRFLRYATDKSGLCF